VDAAVIFYFHSGFMVTGFLLMTAGAAVAIFVRRSRWWLKFHKGAGTSAAVLFLSGFTSGVIMVAVSSGEHFFLVHHYLGLVTTAMALVTPVLGHLQFSMKASAGKIRPLHRWSGRVTLILACVTVVSGLQVAGFI
jgi:hypothetical protein